MKTLFFTFGIGLTVAALLFAFGALRMKRFPAGPALVGVIAVFAILVGGTAAFAVGYANEERDVRLENEANAAREEAANAAQQGTADPNEVAGSKTPAQVAKGPGGTVQLAASPTELAFDTTKLTAKPGKVTIDFHNPSSIPHNVAILHGNDQLAISETLPNADMEASATLAPGTYTFLCTVPGHAEAGMQGVLTVK